MECIAAIIGAGLIGRAWAMVFARAGWRVQLYDNAPTQLDMARGHILTSLTEQQEAGLIDDAGRAAAHVFVFGRIEDAVTGADWVQESRSSPKRSGGGPAASSRIRSIRRTWFPSSSCAARRGPVLRPSSARGR